LSFVLDGHKAMFIHVEGGYRFYARIGIIIYRPRFRCA
jgi:hypothetical protein